MNLKMIKIKIKMHAVEKLQLLILGHPDEYG